jgi:RNA polymerase sigma-70 factor (ECF subfamily)
MPVSPPVTERDPARYEQFVRLLVAHEPHLRSFLRSLLPSWNDVEEAMQETSLTAWRKFDQFEPGSNFLAWTAAIARFEALKQRRTRSRERLAYWATRRVSCSRRHINPA